MSKNIAIDLRALQIGHQNRGIGMVVRSLLENLEDTENHYIFYFFDTSNPIQDLSLSLSVDYTVVTTPYLKNEIKQPKDILDGIKLAHHRFRELKSSKPDVFVQFDQLLGLPRWRKTRKVIVSYDLIPLILRNEYLPSPIHAFTHSSGKKTRVKAFIKAVYYNYRYRKAYGSYKRANTILAISDTVKRSLIELLRVREDRITTMPLAPSSNAAGTDDAILDTLAVRGKPYLLYVGGTDIRKRLEEVVFAFNITNGRGSDVDLVLAGNEFKKVNDIPDVRGRNAIKNSPYKNKIHLAGYITEEQKNSLYENAHAFIFCSTYEGFGLPVIEANAKGCPVIAYDNSAITEIVDNSAMLVETNNYIGVASAAGKLFDKNVRKELTEAGLKQSNKYSWKKSSDIFLKSITR